MCNYISDHLIERQQTTIFFEWYSLNISQENSDQSQVDKSFLNIDLYGLLLCMDTSRKGRKKEFTQQQLIYLYMGMDMIRTTFSYNFFLKKTFSSHFSYSATPQSPLLPLVGLVDGGRSVRKMHKLHTHVS